MDPDDPRTADTCSQYLIPISCQIRDGASYITSRTSESCLDLCSCVKNILSKDCQQEFLFNDNVAICRMTAFAKRREKIRLIKYCVFCDSIRKKKCKKQAEEM